MTWRLEARRSRTLAAMPAIVAGALLMLPIVGVAADAGGGFDAQELGRLLRRDKAATAHFHETQYRRVLTRPVERQGELYFEPPDTFEQRVSTPVVETYRMRGSTLTIEAAGRRTRQVSLRNQPVLAGLLLGFRAVVSGELEALAGHYTAFVAGDAANWHLELVPVDADLAQQIERIRIAGTGKEPRTIEVLEVGGDRSLLKIEPAH